ncbi:MAG: 4Fe-4S dicluster domain-containing protein [Syntrophobacteraceae bacterium]
MPRYAMVIDQRRCIGCMACIAACKTENSVSPGNFRTRVVEIVSGEFPNLRMEMRSELCNHCDNPPCAYNCPTGATYKAKDGTVQVKRYKCVGCKACVAACPYEARYIDRNGVADKCSFCEHRVIKGLEPACVATCIGKSRIFGDLDDPNSAVSRLLREVDASVMLKEAGTGPKVFYIRKQSKLA